MKNKKYLIIISAIAILSFLFITQLLGIVWSEKVLLKSYQPSEINYKSFDPYCLVIVKQQKTMETRLKIKIYKTLGSGMGVYFEMNYFEDYYNEYIKNKEFERAKVEWSNEGVNLEVPMYVWTENGDNFDSKYKLFIPKESFIGGR